MLFCGVDIGTTNTKAVVLCDDGRLLDRVTIAAKERRPKRRANTISWYEHFCQAFDYFASKGHFAGHEVFCSVTGQGGSFVLLNDRFKPVSRVHSWTEQAASDIVGDLIRAFGERPYYHITGWPPHGWLAACKLRQLVRDKKMADGTRFIATVPDFVYSQLAGKLATDITSAQITGMADFEKAQWSPEILKWVGISADLLAAITEGSTILFDKVPTKWGKITFVTGSHDQYAAMQAAGLEKDKSVMLGTGTAWVINGKSSKPIFDDENFLIHPGRDVNSNCFGYIITLWQIGAGFDKLLKRLGVSKERLPDIVAAFGEHDLPDEAIKVDVSNGAIEPAFDADLAIKRYMEWAGSVVAFTLEKTGLGKTLDRIVATGGAMSSRFWPQVIADLCGLTVQAVDFPEFTAYGDALHAMTAASGTVSAGSLPDAATSRTYQPQQSQEYRRWYSSRQRPVLDALT